MYKPDYTTARKDIGFRWYVNATYYTLLDIANLTLRDFNTNPDAGIELFRGEHRQAIKDIFGEEVGIPAISTPSISYGHINGLGVELIFPDGNGEANYAHNKNSLDGYIEILKSKRGIDFSKEGMAPFYIKYKERLGKAYPHEKVEFKYGYEGPITTAYELLDSNVFYDLYDEPEKFKEFLKYLTESIITFTRFHSEMNGQPKFKEDKAELCDDVAAMISPAMWEEFVLPYWHQYFIGITDGRRRVHCENLSAGHMYLLEKALLSNYDPGISEKLNPEIIYKNTRVPFGWRMGSFHLKNLNLTEIADWVYKAVSDGASCIFTILEKDMIDDTTVKKVQAFIKACETAEKMINEGADAESIGELVSGEGRKKFWVNWPK